MVGLGAVVGSVGVLRNDDGQDRLAEGHLKVLLDLLDDGLVHEVLGLGEPVVAEGGGVREERSKTYEMVQVHSGPKGKASFYQVWPSGSV